MASAPPREEGFSKDADKLIRRLSLVAFLLTQHGRPARAGDIRTRVEGYPRMSPDAFKRRFYEDRDELARLGIEIRTEPDPDGGELYSLPPANYYLPPVDLTPEELTALGSCLAVLSDRFSYSKPLRLALLSLAEGRPELLQPASEPPMAVLPPREAQRAAARLPKLQAAVADRKTVVFRYYSIGRDEELERRVDPYALMMVGDEWYLIGRCHLRDAPRTFRLSRIRSSVTFATRKPHDFRAPADFDLSPYRDRPPWQLDRPRQEAVIRIEAGMVWWVQAHFSHCGQLTVSADGSALYRTAYHAARPLLAWTLGLGREARIVAPPELRTAAAEQLSLLRRRLLEPPSTTGAVPADGAHQEGGAPGDWQVEADRFTRLVALTSYLLHRCRDSAAALPVADVCRDLDLTAEQLRLDLRLLNLVNFGGDGALLFAEIKGRRLEVVCDLAGPALTRPARLSPLQADTLLLAVELVGGQVPSATAAALHSAADKLRRARQGEALLAAAPILSGGGDVLAAVNQAVRERRLLAIEYWSEGTGETSSRLVEPHLLLRSRGAWYYVCYCRTSAGTRVFRVDTTKRASPLDETFTPRDDVELDIYRREGIPASGRYLAQAATIWYSPLVRRWIEERQAVERLPDGSCLARQPYADVTWLVHHLLRFGGEAVPVDPPAAVAALRAAVDDRLEVYADDRGDGGR